VALLENGTDAVAPVTVIVPIAVVGAIVSTVKSFASASPTFPVVSTARTRIVCAPSKRPVSVLGLVQVV
jgi:hypothetical protein